MVSFNRVRVQNRGSEADEGTRPRSGRRSVVSTHEGTMARVYDILSRETRRQARLYDIMQKAEMKRQAAIAKALNGGTRMDGANR